MRFAYSNKIDDISAASIIASSEDSSYPVENLQDQRLTTKWHSDDILASTHTVVVDLGATTSCAIFAVLSHNLATAGTVTVNGNDDIASGLSWVTSGQSSTQTLTYNSGPMLLFVSPISNRYWRFQFASQSSALQIGRIWIGNYIDVSPSSLDDFRVIKKRDDTVVYGRGRQKYASIGRGWRRFELSFPRTAGTTLTAMQTFYDAVGNHSSFLFCNFDSIRTYPLVDPCYCSVDGEVGFSHTSRQFYTYQLNLEEDL
jgi:hypothetical protein